MRNASSQRKGFMCEEMMVITWKRKKFKDNFFNNLKKIKTYFWFLLQTILEIFNRMHFYKNIN